MLFQMGNTQSDWTGVQKIINKLYDNSSTDNLIDLDPLGVDNDTKTTGFLAIGTNGNNNSAFEG